MHTHAAPTRAIPALAVAFLALIVLSTQTTVSAQTTAPARTTVDDLVNYEIPDQLFDGTWVDPTIRFDLDPADLVPLENIDITHLSASRTFAAGVELAQVENDTTRALADRHTRVLQVIATLDAEITALESIIREREPEVNTLLTGIRVEQDNAARLEEEIAIRERAIAEFAIRTFIGQDQADLVLTEPDTEFSEARVVSAEVRNDHRAQIATRERDLARRIEAQVRMTVALDAVRDELRDLRRTRVQRITDLEEAESLSEQTAGSYQLALHARLTDFVAGTDIPFVALNAYVVAARTLEFEAPQCQIHWSMLAGIGRIESFHGYFGNSTLDINGQTTEDIRGLPLDGRILSGAEFVSEGASAPAATGRTAETVVTAPAAGPDRAPEQPSPPAQAANENNPGEHAVEQPDTENPEGAKSAEGATGDSAAGATSGVVKTLALILDTDDGVLDGDPVYDRAVGPMQFIPTTWRLFDADGNGDEKTDPQNIYDAALASARYLCASTSTMATPAGEQRAYFAYNHDLDYSRNVTEAGRRYRTLITIDSPEIVDGHGRFYRGILEAAETPETAEVTKKNAPLVDLAQLRTDLATLTLPTW